MLPEASVWIVLGIVFKAFFKFTVEKLSSKILSIFKSTISFN